MAKMLRDGLFCAAAALKVGSPHAPRVCPQGAASITDRFFLDLQLCGGSWLISS